MSFDETVFITGFPGFIAAAAAQLAVAGAQLPLLVQPAFVERARLDIERIALTKRIPARHFRILQGDITTENLGMSLPELQAARTETTTIFPSGRAYDLAVRARAGDKDKSRRYAQCQHFRSQSAESPPLSLHFNLLCGRATQGPHSRNRSLAPSRLSQLLRRVEASCRAGGRGAESRTAPVTIHRPAVVCGDSHTGETAKYDGIYYLIHYLLRMPRFVSC